MAVHAQTTFVEQANAAFNAPYSGANSLDARAVAKETWDVTFYAGVRPWREAEIWINPEIDQGFGLSNTLGAAGFPSGGPIRSASPVPTCASSAFLFARRSTSAARPRPSIQT